MQAHQRTSSHLSKKQSLHQVAKLESINKPLRYIGERN